MGSEGEFGCPAKFRGLSRGPAGAQFFAWAPIFSYGGSSRGPAAVEHELVESITIDVCLVD